MNPAVSSVTAFFPCYNDAPVIGSLVESVHEVLRESVDDFEVVVVDDGSEDDSVAVLRQVAARLPNVRLVPGRARVAAEDRRRPVPGDPGAPLRPGPRSVTVLPPRADPGDLPRPGAAVVAARGASAPGPAADRRGAGRRPGRSVAARLAP